MQSISANKQSFSSNKKTFFNLITLLVLVLGIPLGVFLARQTQIFRPHAGSDPISWVVEGCVIERNGVKIARCPQVKFAINSPFGGPQGGGPNCPSPTPVCTTNSSPKAVVDLVLDDSTSMECTSSQSGSKCKVTQLKVAVHGIKSLIRQTDVIGIQGLKKILLPINTIAANNTKYDQTIDNFQTPNSTPLKDALTMAETEVKRAAGVFPQNPNKVVILVTDGCPDSGQDPRTQGQKLKAAGWTVAILAIQLGTEADGSESPKCAAYGGKEGARQMMKETASDDLFFEVEDAAQIPDSLKKVFTQSVCAADALNEQPNLAGLNYSPIRIQDYLVKQAQAAGSDVATPKCEASPPYINVAWEKRTGDTEKLYKSEVGDNLPSEIIYTGKTTDSSQTYDDHSVTVGKSYSYSLKLYDSKGKLLSGPHYVPTVSNFCSSTGPTPPPGSSAPPTEDPTNACIGTVAYKYAETEAALAGLPEIPYTDGIVIDHTFSDPNPGTKTIFVWFKPKVGTPVIRQLSIELIAEPIIDSIDCQSSQTGTGISLTLDGHNFGPTAGSVTGNDTPTTVTNWTATQVIVTSNTLTCEQVIHAVLTTKDDDQADIIYSPEAQIALGAKLFCRAPQKNDQTNVVLSILGEGDPKVATESVSIDKDGLVQGLKTRLKSGKKYQIGIDAPKSVKTLSLPFISKGTAQVVLRSRDRDLADRRYINVLPIGDIITLGKGDGVINTLDKAELNKEWGFGQGTTAPAGDFNQDGKVNSVDWACMRFDFGSKDAIGPNQQTLNVPIDSQDACPQDAFICPDGSAVGRTAPDCEFAACPNVTAAPVTPAPTTTPAPTPFVWNLSGNFSCDGVNPKSTITWTFVPNASKYDIYKNNALVLADQTSSPVSLLGDTPGVTSSFVVKAKTSSNEVILTSANINITAGTCTGATPTPAATSTPQPTPTP